MQTTLRYLLRILSAMKSFPFLFRVKMVNQAPMVSQENVVLLVPKALLDREAYLESLAEMWVDGISLLACGLQMGDSRRKHALRFTRPPSRAWCPLSPLLMPRALGRFCPPVRENPPVPAIPFTAWGHCLSHLEQSAYKTLPTKQSRPYRSFRSHSTSRNSSWKLFLWWALFKLTGKQSGHAVYEQTVPLCFAG